MIEVREKWEKFGIGYEPSSVRESGQPDKKKIPPVEETFTSVSHIFGNQITMISYEAYNEVVSIWIRQAAPDEKLKNWKTVETSRELLGRSYSNFVERNAFAP